MPVRLWPSDYKNREHITKEEKSLLGNAQRNFLDGHFAVEIDPLGMSSDSSKMGMYISPKEGLITFTIVTADQIVPGAVDAFINFAREIEIKITGRLLDSKALIVRHEGNKMLAFPYKHVFLFCNVNPKKLALSIDEKQKLLNYVAIGFFRPITSVGKEKYLADLKIFDGIRNQYDSDFHELSEVQQIAIFERLAPEYTIITTELERVDVPEVREVISDEEWEITGQELEYKTFALDEYQVNIVNEMGKGHRVILANAGAGKSVLLLAKAFKYASLYKNSKVLLTCFNNNLGDAYLFKQSCADFGNNNNLFIMTFHKLIERIYHDVLHAKLKGRYADNDEVRRCIQLVKDGKLNLKFKAIFIDEVQIFDPLYLTLCYLLLDDSDESTFLMAGDLNQNIRQLSRTGEAPWKKIEGIRLDFTGRVRYIEKNYRNSKEIAVYIRNMLAHMNSRLDMFRLIHPDEFDYNSFTVPDKPSLALRVELGIPRIEIQKRVLAAVKEIVSEYDISYSDIAVLFPYKQHKGLGYFILPWIKTALNENDIPFSQISSTKDMNLRKKYSETNGVVLSTIDSSLGLDFKAVILAGLYPLNYIFREDKENQKISKQKIKSWKSIQEMSIEDQLKVVSQMRMIYTGCSRARDILYVISDLHSDSPIEEILKQK